MKAQDLIIRNFDEAAFVMNRKNWESIFFEGTMSNFVPDILKDNKIKANKYVREHKEDLYLLKKSLENFLQSDNSRQSDELSSNQGNDSISRLCEFSRKNWQIINASIELVNLCN